MKMNVTPKFNLHTHTTFCDGANSAEEMVRAAIELGCEGIGFSGHSYIKGEDYWTMTEEGTPKYIQEVLAAKKTRAEAKALLPTEGGSAADCEGCGACEGVCPQTIPIREHLATVARRLK